MNNTYALLITFLSSSMLWASEEVPMPKLPFTPRTHVRRLCLPESQVLYKKMLESSVKIGDKCTGDLSDKTKKEIEDNNMIYITKIALRYSTIFKYYYPEQAKTLDIGKQMQSEIDFLNKACDDTTELLRLERREMKRASDKCVIL